MVDITSLLTLDTNGADDEYGNLKVGDLVYSPFPMDSSYLSLKTPPTKTYSKTTYSALGAILSPDISNIAYASKIKETGLTTRFWSNIAYGNGVWIATSGGYISNTASSFARSIDNGETWSDIPIPEQGGWTDIVYGNGVWVAICLRNSSGAVTASCLTSHNDGLTWTVRSMPAGTHWADITYGDGVFVAVAGGALATTTISAWSVDGINWVSSTLPLNVYWTGVAFGGGVFIAINAYNNAAISFDKGKTWIIRSFPALNTGMNQIDYGNGVFICIPGGGHISNNMVFITKNYGLIWTQVTLPSSQFWGGIAYSNGIWAAVAGYYSANTNIIVTSDDDGATWTQRTLDGDSVRWTGIGANNGKFIAVPSRDAALAPVNNINIINYAVNPTTFVLPTSPVAIKNATPYIKAL